MQYFYKINYSEDLTQNTLYKIVADIYSLYILTDAQNLCGSPLCLLVNCSILSLDFPRNTRSIFRWAC